MFPKTQKQRHVVIIGGGFGGLETAKRSRKSKVRVTLVDRHNYHLFQPLLYQVATGGLSPANIATPLRYILRRQPNCEVLLGEVTDIDLAKQRVILADGEIHYDELVVAAGATHSYFGRDDWEPNAPGLKSIADALDIRRRIFLAFEAAEREPDPEIRKALMTFVIVGGGPTGVELAGALSEIARHTLKYDFRHIKSEDARIILVEASEHVSPHLTPGNQDNVFVIGDLATCLDEAGKPLPGLAPVAMQQGAYVAKVIMARSAGNPTTDPFNYVDRGSMATIGRAAAVAQIGKRQFCGFFAWLLWLVIHLLQIVQFQNRLLILMQWAWNYFTYHRSSRIITGQDQVQIVNQPAREAEVKQEIS